MGDAMEIRVWALLLVAAAASISASTDVVTLTPAESQLSLPRPIAGRGARLGAAADPDAEEAILTSMSDKLASADDGPSTSALLDMNSGDGDGDGDGDEEGGEVAADNAPAEPVADTNTTAAADPHFSALLVCQQKADDEEAKAVELANKQSELRATTEKQCEERIATLEAANDALVVQAKQAADLEAQQVDGATAAIQSQATQEQLDIVEQANKERDAAIATIETERDQAIELCHQQRDSAVEAIQAEASRNQTLAQATLQTQITATQTASEAAIAQAESDRDNAIKEAEA